MVADNVFAENQDYLIKARDTVNMIEDLKDDLDEMRMQQKKHGRSIAQEEKSINDDINTTLKKRKEQIAVSYDKQIETNNAKIKQIQSKKERKKNQRMEARIESETEDLKEQNRQLRIETKTLFKQNHVPGFCNSDLYYCLFSPKGMNEILELILILALCFIGIPGLVLLILLHTKFSEGSHTVACVLIASIIIIVEFILYFVIFNITKVKHRDSIAEGRKTRDKIYANEKAIKAIKNSITKDKDESIYNLEKYDKKIKQLERDGDDISDQKKEALKLFEKETQQLIVDEIQGRRMPKLDKMKEDAKKLDSKIAETESRISELEMTMTNEYETYLGKDFCTEERLSDLISIMEEGSASTVSEAIKVYKGDDK